MSALNKAILLKIFSQAALYFMISKFLFSIFDASLFKFSAIDNRHISLIMFSFPLWWNLL